MCRVRVLNHLFERTTQFASVEMLNKFLKRFRPHGIVSWPFAFNPPPSYKWYLYVRQRYGHPEIQFLATLK